MSPAHRWLPFCVFFLLAFAFAMACFLPIAMAQPVAAPVADGVVNLAPLVDAVFSALVVALTAVVAWVGRVAFVWLKVDADSKVRAYVQETIGRGVAYGLEQARAWAATNSSVKIRSATVELAAEYILAAVPDGLKRLGVTEEKLKRLIEARLAPQVFKSAPAPLGTESL